MFVAMLAGILGASLWSAALSAQTAPVVDPETGLKSWHWEEGPIAISLNQRLPDQSRAYFQARGFGQADAERIASACVFQAIIHNHPASTQPMALDLAEWRVIKNGQQAQGLYLESQWQETWQQRAVTQAARIAFRWSLFPSQQVFQPGDWSMGMLTFGLSAGERFDLLVTWKQGDTSQSHEFNDMQCAEDQHL